MAQGAGLRVRLAVESFDCVDSRHRRGETSGGTEGGRRRRREYGEWGNKLGKEVRGDTT